MNEQERGELELNEQELDTELDLDLDLDDIMKEFGAEEERQIHEASAQELLEAALSEAGVRLGREEEEEPAEETAAAPVEEEKDDTVIFAPAEEMGDTQAFAAVEVTGDTVSFAPVEDAAEEMAGEEEELGDTLRFGEDDMETIRQAAEQVEPYSEKWEPEYDQPIGEYVPPQPIVFRPRSRLRELKRKLVAGPEKRYYELAELGLGRLQAAIFLCFIIVLLSGGALLLHGLDMVRADRMRLMVFGQVLGSDSSPCGMSPGIGYMYRCLHP